MTLDFQAVRELRAAVGRTARDRCGSLADREVGGPKLGEKLRGVSDGRHGRDSWVWAEQELCLAFCAILDGGDP